jgi:hypothetical protein
MSNAVSGNTGFEFGAGGTLKFGGNLGGNFTNSSTGGWYNDNSMLDELKYTGPSASGLRESVYYKPAGTMSFSERYTGNCGEGSAQLTYGPTPQRIKLKPLMNVCLLDNKFVDKYGNMEQILSDDENCMHQNVRIQRSQPLSYLTRDEAAFFGISKYVSPHAKSHHVAEVTITQEDGSRYIYGIAAYNIRQVEVTFNASQGVPDIERSKFTYNSDDNTSSNQRGIDHFFHKITTPSYSHSYLITEVLSNDYVDCDAVQGPSPEDRGFYTKFDYDSDPNIPGAQPDIASYRWRTPYETNSSSYSEVLKSDKMDDRGSYMYGEKEVWYLHKIETKTHVAVFYTSEREDGFEVLNENGGQGTETVKKLDKIELYSRPEYEAHITNLNEATPIKTVHFEYDYSLCDGIPNNTTNSGKLTLRQLYFTYGKSNKGAMSPYVFSYADNNHDGIQEANFNYHEKAYDRWGSYKENGYHGIPNWEYPYAVQEYEQAAINSAAWSLTAIKTPSAALLQITYESDDYSYVQDKLAMEMFKVVKTGFDNGSPGTFPNTTYVSDNALYDPDHIYDYLFFDLKEGYTDISQYWNSNLVGVKMYFRFLMNLKDEDNLASEQEYVSGYAIVEDAGICSDFPGTTEPKGWIKVKAEPVGDNNGTAHPISKTSWQFGQLHNPTLMFNQPNMDGDASASEIFNQLANVLGTFNLSNLLSVNSKFKSKNFSDQFVVDHAWIRLLNPSGKKLGGGSRVKKLIINDSWDSMNGQTQTSNEEGIYGQEFQYVEENGKSSGVASYEPMSGADENPFRIPSVSTDQKLLMAPDHKFYQEEPFGEMFFPSPSVGYGRVVTRNLIRENVSRHGTGYSVNEFYTAKDYPIRTDRTNLSVHRSKSSEVLNNLLNLQIYDFVTTSQGYVVETNDMHGKPKGQWIYSEPKQIEGVQVPGTEKLISGVRYNYNNQSTTNQYNYENLMSESFVISGNSDPINTIPAQLQTMFGENYVTPQETFTHLDNTVTIIKPDMTVQQNVEVGVDYEVVNDFRESSTSSHSAAIQGNLSMFLAAIFPAVVPSAFPGYTNDKLRYRSSVTTKLIHRYGILRSVTAYDGSSQVTTENLAFDSETGEPILTTAINEFGDKIFNFKYPAHWAYTGMEQAYKNIGAQVNLDSDYSTVPGDEWFTNPVDHGTPIFVSGDEVFDLETKEHLWVWVDETQPGHYYFIDISGNIKMPSEIKIVRSGRRNNATVPIGTITCLKNPLEFLDVNNRIQFNETLDIVQSSALEYSDKWRTNCTTAQQLICEPNFNELQGVFNLFDWLTESHLICANNSSVPIPSEIVTWSGISNPIWTSGSCASQSEFTGFISYAVPERCDISISAIEWDVENAEWIASALPTVFSWSDLNSFGTYEILDNQNIRTLGIFFNGTNYEFLPLNIEVSCANFLDCNLEENGTLACAEPLEGEIRNPFVIGTRGNQRPIRNYAYLTNRLKTENIRHDGTFANFSPAWEYQANRVTLNDDDENGIPDNWTYAAEITNYDAQGNEIENIDALGIYSSVLFGYGDYLVKAAASNASHREIAFDGFEDYAYNNPAECCPGHFDFMSPGADFSANRTDAFAHTGRFSLNLEASDILYVERPVTTSEILPISSIPEDEQQFDIDEEDILTTFSPLRNKKYILSYWVYIPQLYNQRVFDYPSLTCTISGTGATYVVDNVRRSEIIDGWQRVELEFTVPTSATDIRVSFQNTGIKDTYIDDIRIHPFNSSLKSYVFDPITLRLSAELDERNFATFYEYDIEGQLSRIKKETERGVMTVQEARQNSSKIVE